MVVRNYLNTRPEEEEIHQDVVIVRKSRGWLGI
jgi:hypothetical protein